MNFNDIWAITGIPVSPFDARDADVQVTGSGGVGMVAQLVRTLSVKAVFRGRYCEYLPGQSELTRQIRLDLWRQISASGIRANDGSLRF